jgi:hypothetical protein
LDTFRSVTDGPLRLLTGGMARSMRPRMVEHLERFKALVEASPAAEPAASTS